VNIDEAETAHRSHLSCWEEEMVDESDIRNLAEYLVRTWGQEARDFVAGRLERSEQPEEWQRVAEVVDTILAPGKRRRA
jgi:hypothetical protein